MSLHYSQLYWRRLDVKKKKQTLCCACELLFASECLRWVRGQLWFHGGAVVSIPDFPLAGRYYRLLQSTHPHTYIQLHTRTQSAIQEKQIQRIPSIILHLINRSCCYLWNIYSPQCQSQEKRSERPTAEIRFKAIFKSNKSNEQKFC